MTKPKALLFDLGGVVIEVDIRQSFDHWGKAAGIDPVQLARQNLRDETHERYERGEIATAEYMEHLERLLQLDIGHDRMVEGWNALLVGAIEGIADVLKRLSGTVPLYAFSNTNAAHVENFTRRFEDVLSHFDEVYVSPAIGHRKPELPSFLHVAEAIGLAPGEILFFDDSAENLEGAREAGLRTVHVRSHDDVLEGLARHGF